MPTGTGQRPPPGRCRTARWSAPPIAASTGWQKPEYGAHQGAFEPGGAVRVPHRPVREDQGRRIGRPRPGDAVALVPGTAEVLDGGEEPAAFHLAGRRPLGERRSGGFCRRALRKFGDRQEPHLIARHAAARRALPGIEEQRRVHPPEEVPAARRHPGVDAGLRAGHGDRPRRDPHPGDRAARDVEARVGHPEVREPRRETDDVDAVVASGMDPDQLFHRHPDQRRHVRKVLAVIDAGDLQQARFRLGFPAGAAREFERVGADGVRVRLRIVEDEHRAEGGDRFPVSLEGLPFEQRRQRGGLPVQLKRDFVPELDREGRLARANSPWIE